MYEESLTLGELPIDQRIVTIVTIHKSGKPADEAASYRPISLINSESKILAKALATRLQPHLQTLIHPDQSGFMPNRNTALSLRRLHSVIVRRDTIEEDAAILSLDAHMAFDKVEWPFLFAVLHSIGFGRKFCAWVRLLYTRPLAHVAVNGRMSAYFPLSRGTRQGCPLSPLLFALMLEPLAVWIRQDPIIRGLRWTQGWEDRVSLYADDMLLYLASPTCSITRILDICAAYGYASGYTINWSKSILYILHGPPPKHSRIGAIQITEEGFKYLGIYITHHQPTFLSKNVMPPLSRFRKDVGTWRTLPLTLLGRSALYKMKMLPRLLYVLQNTPFLVEPKYLADITSEVSKLLWDGKANRIAMDKLVRGWYDGGIALPNIKAYYWAAHLMIINHWIRIPQDEPAYRMDRHLMGHDQWFRVLYNKCNDRNITGPTKHTTLWHVAKRTLGWEGTLTKTTPLWCTKKLGNLRNTKGFKQWDQIGIPQIGDLWRNGNVISFEKLQQTYTMTSTEHYRYIQIRHALTTVIRKGTNPPETSPLEDRLLTEHMPKKAISLTYKKIIYNMPDPLNTLRDRWQHDIGILDDSEWQEALSSPKEIAIPSRLN